MMLGLANQMLEVWRPQKVQNARGVQERAMRRVAMNVPAYVEEETGTENIIAGLPRSTETGKAIMDRVIARGITINQDDQLRFGDRVLRIDKVRDIKENESFASQVRVFWTEVDNAEV